MRMIDADEFKKQIAAMAITNNYPADKANKMCELIDCQPTAYDVDKVVEQLKNNADYITGEDGTVVDEYVYLSKAVKIIKSGGID